MAYLRIELVPQLDSEDYPHVIVLAYTDFAQTYRRLAVEEFAEYGATDDQLADFMASCDELGDICTHGELRVEVHGYDDFLELLESKSG